MISTTRTTARKFLTADHDSGDDESTSSSSSSSSTNNSINNSNKNKSVRFCLNKITIHTIPRITNEEWPLVFYDQDELAEFRYQAFHDEILEQEGRL